MAIYDKPTYAPVANDFFELVSVSSSASMPGGFRGLYVNASTTLTMTSRTGNEVVFNDVPPGAILWVSGSFVNQIHTATGVVGFL